MIKRVKQPLETPSSLNKCWSMDLMCNAFKDGRKLLVFNVIDDCNREALVIDAGLSYSARARVETLESLKDEIGTPKYVRYDNGPEFTSEIFMNWCTKTILRSNTLSQVSRCRMDTYKDLTVFLERIY